MHHVVAGASCDYKTSNIGICWGMRGEILRLWSDGFVRYQSVLRISRQYLVGLVLPYLKWWAQSHENSNTTDCDTLNCVCLKQYEPKSKVWCTQKLDSYWGLTCWKSVAPGMVIELYLAHRRIMSEEYVVRSRHCCSLWSQCHSTALLCISVRHWWYGPKYLSKQGGFRRISHVESLKFMWTIVSGTTRRQHWGTDAKSSCGDKWLNNLGSRCSEGLSRSGLHRMWNTILAM